MAGCSYNACRVVPYNPWSNVLNILPGNGDAVMRYFKPRLVRFPNNTYGLRGYWCFGWHFINLKGGSLKHAQLPYNNSLHKVLCQGTLKEAMEWSL